MSIAVVSSCYGDYEKFEGEWWKGIRKLNRQPDEVCIARGESDGPHTQARLMNEAVRATNTDWVWPLGIDNVAFPWALDYIEELSADVAQFGYLRSDGAPYLVPRISPHAYLSKTPNPFVSDSPFRREAFERVGGFPLVGFEDWGLWRRMVRAGVHIAVSPRLHFLYRLHEESRSTLEYTESVGRQELYDELLRSEAA